MKKVIVVLCVFFIGVFSIFSDSVMNMDGTDWSNFTEEQKTFIVMGAMLSSAMNYETAGTLNASGDLSPKGERVFKGLNDMRVQVGYVIKQINNWYNETRSWDTELYYVLFGSIGNLDGLVPIIEKLEERESLENL